MPEQIPNELPDLLLGLRRKINQSTKENKLKHELTMSQLEILWFIGSAGKKSMESIADYLNVKPPSVTAIIDKLQKGNMVKREKDPNDRRIVFITLTTKTNKQFEAFRKHKEAVLNKIVSKLSPKDRRELQRIISILIK